MANIVSVMTGTVWKVLVSVGDHVEHGQDILILESMKMEIPVAADRSGTITEIKVSEGEFVNEGDVVVEIE